MWTSRISPLENSPWPKTRTSSKSYNFLMVFGDLTKPLSLFPGLKKLDVLSAFEEHLKIIEERMKDNGYNIKVHVPDKVIMHEITFFKSIASESKSSSFDLAGYMNKSHFLPLISCAVTGRIKDGEFAFFDLTGPFVHLCPNHDADDGFNPPINQDILSVWAQRKFDVFMDF
ncbi:hypothetical protein FBEOM_7554 [Fusarium beomiforme]|uniref:Uncharacterized protein n=1 Tax=Fusarium beomiforme TaxID=44412 RepID=A0A9P5DWX7_9HYPO|nr:hypothetical protein FBEOM_7554 [Fusarium beomiforme]